MIRSDFNRQIRNILSPLQAEVDQGREVHQAATHALEAARELTNRILKAEGFKPALDPQIVLMTSPRKKEHVGFLCRIPSESKTALIAFQKRPSTALSLQPLASDTPESRPPPLLIGALFGDKEVTYYDLHHLWIPTDTKPERAEKKAGRRVKTFEIRVKMPARLIVRGNAGLAVAALEAGFRYVAIKRQGLLTDADPVKEYIRLLDFSVA